MNDISATSTTLSADFLRAVVLMLGFKGTLMLRAQAAMLYLALEQNEFTASSLPKEVTGGSKHLAGAATGSLVATGLLTVVGRVKSPDPAAKGRKLDVLTAPSREKCRTWLRANGFSAEVAVKPQRELAI